MNDPHVAQKIMTYDAAKKDMVLAYIIWFFLGTFGVHRLYIGKTISGILMAIFHICAWALTIVFVGFIGLAIIGVIWLIDALFLAGWVEDYNLQLANQIG